ncbi:unnamed protein product, partial [Prorocentrum cordatum]
QVAQMTGSCRVSDAIRSRFSAWKAQKSELYTSLPKARYGLTDYHDTRHITEPSVPLSGQYMPDSERFKTTNHVMSAFSVPDHAHPQTSDDLRKHSLREYKVERIRDRQRDFSERCWAANEAAQNFDDRKMAHKALTLMNYERQTRTDGLQLSGPPGPVSGRAAVRPRAAARKGGPPRRRLLVRVAGQCRAPRPSHAAAPVPAPPAPPRTGAPIRVSLLLSP